MTAFVLKSIPRGAPRIGIAVVAGLLLTACTPPPDVPAPQDIQMPDDVEMATLEFTSEVIAEGFSVPWSIEVLADGEYLVSERMGELVHIKDGHSTELRGLPKTQTFNLDRHYGGMMDVSLHPLFSENRRVYLAYLDRDYRMMVARFVFTDVSIQDFEVIFESNGYSLGSRIEWEDESHFFVTQGMAGAPLPDPGAQNLDFDGGKIHRLIEDGSVPDDNPILEGQSGPTSIWSYGHRDTQGLFLDKTTGIMYATEHGPLGGDELNIIEKGGNYGWPRFSYGLNYDGTTVGDLSEEEADSLTILPLKSWGPSFNMAPSGLAPVTLPTLGPRLVWGSLLQRRLIAHDVESGMTSVIIEGIGRVRDLTQLPSGDLIVLIDAETTGKRNSGRVVKLTFR